MSYLVDDKQFNFLQRLRVELDPLDENADRLLCKVLEDREYNDFQRNVIRDLRARWIRQEGLHINDNKLEDELNNLNRR